MEESSVLKPEVLESLQVLRDFEQVDCYKLKQAETRNIIFVGRSRAGKSTVFKVLKKSTHVARYGSLFAGTKEACLYSFTVDFKEENAESKSYTINIIDTPGLFEVSADNKARNNDIIKNTIATCLTSEITKVHAIFFVCSFEGGVQDEDMKAFSEFVEFFHGAEDHVALLITRCEDFSPQRKEALKEDVKIVLQNRNLPEGLRQRIFFSGTLTEDLLEDGVPAARKRIASVKDMRSKLFKWIFNMKNFCQLDNLDFFKLQTHKANDFLDELEAFVKALPPKAEDFEKSKPQAKVLRDEMARLEPFILHKADQQKLRALVGHGVFSS